MVRGKTAISQVPVSRACFQTRLRVQADLGTPSEQEFTFPHTGFPAEHLNGEAFKRTESDMKEGDGTFSTFAS